MKPKKPNTDDLLKQFFPKIPKERVDAARAATFAAIKEALKGKDTSSWSLGRDNWSVGSVTQEEFEILSAIVMVDGPRNPVDISTAAAEWNPDLSDGNVWPMLEDLERRGFVKERPGKSRGLRLYEATGDGRKAIERARAEGKVLGVQRAGVPLKDSVPEKPKP